MIREFDNQKYNNLIKKHNEVIMSLRKEISDLINSIKKFPEIKSKVLRKHSILTETNEEE